MTTVAAEGHQPPKVKTFAINHGGDIESFPYVPIQTVAHEIVQAIARFHLAAQPHQLGLFQEQQTEPLEPGKTLEQAGVHAGETLILKPIVVQGG